MARTKGANKGKKGGIATHSASENAGMNPIAAGVMGAVAGAAVGATAAVVLSDEKTRNKIGDVFNNISKNAPKMVDQGKQRVKELRDKASDIMSDAQEQLSGSTDTKELKSGKTKVE